MPSATFIVNAGLIAFSSVSRPGQFSYKTRLDGGNVVFELYADPSGQAQPGRLALSLEMSTAEAAALATLLSTPSAGVGP